MGSKKHGHARENARCERAIDRMEKKSPDETTKRVINNTLSNMGRAPKYYDLSEKSDPAPEKAVHEAAEKAEKRSKVVDKPGDVDLAKIKPERPRKKRHVAPGTPQD